MVRCLRNPVHAMLVLGPLMAPLAPVSADSQQDHSGGIIRLATLYRIGEGGVVDLDAAAQWLRRGVDLGSDEARTHLDNPLSVMM